MDLRLAPNAIAMSSKEFIAWSTDVMAQLMRATGVKKAVDKISAPIWSWALRNANYPPALRDRLLRLGDGGRISAEVRRRDGWA